MSPEIMPFVSKFEVLDFDITLSDVHNPVLLSLCNNNYVMDTKDIHSYRDQVETFTSFIKPFWDSSMKIPYQEAVDIEQIENVNFDLNQYLLDLKTVDLQIINNLNSRLNDILTRPADSLGCFKHKSPGLV